MSEAPPKSRAFVKSRSAEAEAAVRGNMRVEPITSPNLLDPRVRWGVSFFSPGWDVCSISNVIVGYYKTRERAMAAARKHKLWRDESYQLTIAPIPESAFKKPETCPTCGAKR